MLNKKLFYGLCIGFVALSCLLPLTPDKPATLADSLTHPSCNNVGLYDDQCAFVKKACSGYSRFYLEFYYCSGVWQPLIIFLLCCGLFILFGAGSVAASDFFCPNLQTISSKLQLSESMAGVTILAFGNGSSDLFSTFSAMNSGSGSLAIGELIGAAFFIVSVVSGSMGIIRPFRSKRITFMRDASFLTGAICMITWIVYHRRIYWYHGLGLIAYYITYVILVVCGTYFFPDTDDDHVPPFEIKSTLDEEHLVTETSRLLEVDAKRQPEPSSSTVTSLHHFGHVIRPVSIRSSSQQSMVSSMRLGSSIYGAHTSASGSIASRYYRMPLAPRVGIRTSLFSAIEFQEQVTSIQRANSTQVILPTSSSPNPSFRGWARATDYSAPSLLPPGAVLLAPHPPPSTSTSSHPRLHRPSSNSNLTQEPQMPPSNRDDYFSYISDHQHRLEQQPPHTVPPMPEIRVAPVADDADNNLDDTLKSMADKDTHLSPTTTTEAGMDPAAAAAAMKAPMYGVNVGPFSMPLDTYLWWEDVLLTLFPPLQGWASKTFFAKLSSLVAMPLVFIFTLTLPVVESDDLKIDDLEVTPSEHHVLLTSDAGLFHPEPSHTTAFPTSSSYLAISNYTNAKVPSLTVPESATSAAHPTSSGNNSHVTSHHTSPVLNHHDASMPIDSSFHLDDHDPMDDPMIQYEWCQWLVIVQAVFSCSFAFAIMVLNGILSTNFLAIGVLLGCVLGFLVFLFTNEKQQPTWYWYLSFVGFVISLNWIFLLANLMVGLLQALGAIFGISEAIMGLTIFAVGSSMGDLVANTAIAKMGFPTMAISACYAGPLLNMVLGVGISSAYQTILTGAPYKLDIAPTILVSSCGLIVVLLSTLIVVNLNGYCMNKELGWWMISVYIVCCLFDVLLEMDILM
ncbi:hypothetical protein DM01DRAFT_1337810 [Hesseltinella vesiculosa]|uniref:Sodium/calcium exchanger membrane region domain-containing protein n=1 Tax=Hesseltinella vesiculosa TaxID=101127 RepID=A0A1X2GBV3_9FUNG|nr:hypothetical protein DM01DRAFT_1337810 [Hesseltinella vesiculosa]